MTKFLWQNFLRKKILRKVTNIYCHNNLYIVTTFTTQKYLFATNIVVINLNLSMYIIDAETTENSDSFVSHTIFNSDHFLVSNYS